MSSMPTVWILGAGFSQALGAPLFRDLFQSEERIDNSGYQVHPHTTNVLLLYRRFGPRLEGREGRGQVWRDPEEFIDFIESAKSASGGAREFLEGVIGGVPVDLIADIARRMLAIECSIFLRGADPTTERWLPYRLWAPRFSREDTIVTFNYDRVFELLKEKCKAEVAHHEVANHYEVIVPNGNADRQIGETRDLDCAPILKLHGSVDWIAADGKIRADPAESLLAMPKTGEEIVLAVPGPNKIGVRDRFGEIRLLWKVARDAVQSASRIVFIGYRFPQTDAQSRVEILKAIQEASANGNLLKVWIVLGPDEKHPDVARMLKLLRFVCPERVEVSVLPLYGEDFLSMVGIASNLV